jgi:N-acetylglucosamine kinase-like BadF-type ATPase
MARYFLGIDVGNGRTLAVVADEEGQVIGHSVGGAGNHEVYGTEAFSWLLPRVSKLALSNAGLANKELAGTGFGIAGYDWESDLPLMNKVIGSLGLNAPYEVVNDAVLGLVAGTSEGWGVCVSAATSANCRGRDAEGNQGRVTGEGTMFGEYGGRIELVTEAMRRISRAWSMRGPSTMLTDLFLERYKVATPAQMFEGVARRQLPLSSEDALLVFAAAQDGDAVAKDCIVFIGRELGSLALGVSRQLGFDKRESFEVVLAGGFYKGSPLIEESLKSVLLPEAPGAKIIHLTEPPAVGAVMLGMAMAGIDFRPLRARLLETIRAKIGDADLGVSG